MPGDGTELISNQAAVVAPFAPASNEPQLGDDELVHAPADQAAEAAVLQSELGSDPADEGQTEHSEPESALDGAGSGNDNAQEAVATQPDADPRSALEKQAYECEKCTIQVAIQLLPNDGDAKGRPVLIGVRSHLDAPIVQMLRLDELGLLPPAITALIEQLKAELPARAQAAGQRAAKAKE